MANFAYIGFALNRLSLIGKDHGAIVNYTSNLTLKQFLCRIFLICMILPVVKLFRFLPNFSSPESEYPNPISSYFNKIGFTIVFVYMSFNILFDMINYVVFLIVHLIVDLCLVVKMKQTLEEKEKKKEKIIIFTNKNTKR